MSLNQTECTPLFEHGPSPLFPSQATAAHQVDGEAAEPVPTFIVLAFDALEACLPQPGRERGKRLSARVAGRELRDDAFQHPCAAEVQSSQMVELAVGDINHTRGLQIH